MEVIPIHARGIIVAKAHDVMYVIPIHARGPIIEYVFGCSNHGRKNFWLKRRRRRILNVWRSFKKHYLLYTYLINTGSTTLPLLCYYFVYIINYII